MRKERMYVVGYDMEEAYISGGASTDGGMCKPITVEAAKKYLKTFEGYPGYANNKIIIYKLVPVAPEDL